MRTMKEGKAKMTDITRNLEILGNIKPGDPWPSNELGGDCLNYIPAISAICAEALAEIKRLRECGQVGWKTIIRAATAPNMATVIEWHPLEVDYMLVQKPEPELAPELWGSPYAMNTENWK